MEKPHWLHYTLKGVMLSNLFMLILSLAAAYILGLVITWQGNPGNWPLFVRGSLSVMLLTWMLIWLWATIEARKKGLIKFRIWQNQQNNA